MVRPPAQRKEPLQAGLRRVVRPPAQRKEPLQVVRPPAQRKEPLQVARPRAQQQALQLERVESLPVPQAADLPPWAEFPARAGPLS